MAGAFAEAYVQISPKMDDFAGALKRALSGLRNVEIPVSLKFDPGKIQSQLADLTKAQTVNITANADAGKAKTILDGLDDPRQSVVTAVADAQKATSLLNGLDKPHQSVVSAVADVGKATVALGDLAKPIAPTVIPKTDASAARVELESLAKPIEPPLTPLVDDGAAIEALTALQRAIDVSLVVRADVARARSEIESIGKTLAVPVIGVPDFGRVRDELESLAKGITVPIDATVSGRSDGGTSKGKPSGSAGGANAGAAIGGIVGAAGGPGGAILGAAGGAAIIGTLTKALGLAGDLDRTMGRIGISISKPGQDASVLQKQLLDLRITFQKLGADPAFGKLSTVDFANAADVLTKANIPLKELKDLLPAVGSLSVASGIDAEKSAKLVSGFSNIFRVQTKDQLGLVDALAASEKAGVGTIEDYGDAVNYVGSQYNSMADKTKPAIERTKDLLGTFVFLDNQLNKRGSKAGTGYQSFLSDITGGGGNKAAKTIAELSDKLRKQGVIAKDSGDMFFKSNGALRDMTEIQKNLQLSTSDLNGLDKQRLLNTIFQTDSQQIANGLIDDTNGKLAESIKSTREVGLAEQFRANNAKGYAGAIDAVSGATDSLLTSIGDLWKANAEGVLRPIADLFGRVATVLTTVNMGGFSAGLKALREQFPLVDSASKFFETNLLPTLRNIGSFVSTTLLPIFGRIGSALGGAFESAKGAISSVIDFIGGIIGRLNLGSLLDHVKGIFSGLGQIIQGSLQSLGGVFDVIKGIFHGKWSEIWDGLKRIFSGLWTSLVGAVRAAFHGLGATFEVVRGILAEAWSKAWSILKEAFPAIWSGIVSGVKAGFAALPGLLGDVGSFLLDVGRKLLAGLSNGLKEHWPFVKQFLLDSFRGIPGVLGDVGSFLLEKGRQLLEGLGRGIVEYGPKVGSWVLDQIKKIPGALGAIGSFLLDKGKELLGGLGDGIKEYGPKVGSWVLDQIKKIPNLVGAVGSFLLDKGKDLLTGLKDGASNVWTNTVLPFIKGIPGKIVSAIGSGLSLLAGFGKDLIQGIINAVKTKITELINLVKSIPGRIPNIAAAVMAKIPIVGGIVSVPKASNPGVPGRAAGGPVEAGTPYIVGEEGPELFFPRISGEIFTNKDSARILEQAKKKSFDAAGIIAKVLTRNPSNITGSPTDMVLGALTSSFTAATDAVTGMGDAADNSRGAVSDFAAATDTTAVAITGAGEAAIDMGAAFAAGGDGIVTNVGVFQNGVANIIGVTQDGATNAAGQIVATATDASENIWTVIDASTLAANAAAATVAAGATSAAGTTTGAADEFAENIIQVGSDIGTGLTNTIGDGSPLDGAIDGLSTGLDVLGDAADPSLVGAFTGLTTTVKGPVLSAFDELVAKIGGIGTGGTKTGGVTALDANGNPVQVDYIVPPPIPDITDPLPANADWGAFVYGGTPNPFASANAGPAQQASGGGGFGNGVNTGANPSTPAANGFVNPNNNPVAAVVAAATAAAAAVFGGKKAAGGPVLRSTPYLVGERGPELFVPHLDGVIVPNGSRYGGDTAALLAQILDTLQRAGLDRPNLTVPVNTEIPGWQIDTLVEILADRIDERLARGR